jgi:hypothetical protein
LELCRLLHDLPLSLSTAFLLNVQFWFLSSTAIIAASLPDVGYLASFGVGRTSQAA